MTTDTRDFRRTSAPPHRSSEWACSTDNPSLQNRSESTGLLGSQNPFADAAAHHHGMGFTGSHHSRHPISTTPSPHYPYYAMPYMFPYGSAPPRVAIMPQGGDPRSPMGFTVQDGSLEFPSLLESISKEGHTPLVFQCRICSSIVGDSYAYNSFEKKLKCLIMKKGHVNLKEGEQKLKELDTIYSEFFCRKCNKCLGRKFLATPKKWDHVRDMYAYDINTVRSYQLGEDNLEDESNLVAQLPDTITLHENLSKLQKLVLNLNGRLAEIEASVCLNNSSRSQTHSDLFRNQNSECASSRPNEHGNKRDLSSPLNEDDREIKRRVRRSTRLGQSYDSQ